MVAVSRERNPCNILQRKVRLTVFRNTGVVESGDIRVVEAGKNRSLPQQALRQPPRHKSLLRELQGHASRKLPVDTLGQPNGRHAAVPDEGADAVGAESPANEAWFSFGES